MNQLFLNPSNFVKVIGLSRLKKIKKALSSLILITLVVTVTFSFLPVTESRAQGNPSLIRQIQAIESDVSGLKNPAGLTFSGNGNAFHVIDAGPAASTDLEVIKLTPFSERAGSVRIPEKIQNPINMVFDNGSNRLLFLHGQGNQLLEVPANLDGNINPADFIRYDARNLGLQNPQGMTIDESSGSLFILDAKESRIVKVDPASDGSFNGAEISEIDLHSLGLSAVRGLALDPVSGHLFVINPQEQTLYELAQSSELISKRDLKPFRLMNPQAMVFAPSGDQTDDPSQMSLYMADSGLLDEQDSTSATQQTSDAQKTGQIIEFSLTAAIAPAAANFTTSLIKTTDMAAISPPGPDPSGIAYLPASDTLLIVDGEVEEIKGGITHFAGANVWELTLLGSKVGTANISEVAPTATPMTDEPTGIALNSDNGHYYITDDDARMVYDLNAGADATIGTADDTWTSFSTLGIGSGDPEGVAFNTWNNHIFVVDGVNAEVYEFTISGTLVGQFDVQQYGAGDPEGIEFNSDTGTLFIMSSNKSTRVIVETTITGELLQTIDISAANSLTAAGLVYAPASDGSGLKRFYIVDRGIDNNDDPTLIDGKVYELTAPVPGSTPTPSATFTATSTFTPGPSSTFTPTSSPTSLPPSTLFYASFASGGSLNGLSYADEDIVRFNGSSWSLFFDGSDVGLKNTDIYAFALVDPDTVLMSLNNAITLGNLAIVPQDVVQFNATSLGSVTAGSFSMYLDGSDVGLDTSSENIDALSLLADGNLLISTTGNPVVPGVSGSDEDILAFNPTSLGDFTSGSWSLYFDGSDVGLAESSNEDIDAADVTSDGSIYLSTLGDFAVSGVSGTDEDVFVCVPASIGNNTACNYLPNLYFDGDAWGLASNDLNAFNFMASGSVPTAAPSNTPTQTPSATATATNTPTQTPSATATYANTPTQTPSAAATVTFVPTSTFTPTRTPTATTTVANTPTQTPSATTTIANTPTRTPTATTTVANTPTPLPPSTSTPTNTSMPSPSFTPTQTITASPTSSAADLIFADSFESGNFSTWDASITNSGNLSVSQNAALTGSYGLQAAFNSPSSMYVRDDSPNAEPRYRVRFYFHPNSVSMATGNYVYLLQGHDTSNRIILFIQFYRSSSGYQLRVRAYDSVVGNYVNTPYLTVSNAWHAVEVDWANDGHVTFWIDGAQAGNLTGLNNSSYGMESVRLGAPYMAASGMSGMYYIDAFESRRQSYIGP